MALFVGGPADGHRIEVESSREYVDIAINPNPPAFTPDISVLNPELTPTFRYKKELLHCGNEFYAVFVPTDWGCSELVESLIINYRKNLSTARTNYLNTAEGILYDNDDRIPSGRPYRV